MKSVQRAKELNKLLVECNFPSICIHGQLSQTERLEVRTAPLPSHSCGSRPEHWSLITGTLGGHASGFS